jgi:hypothetical protein
MNSTALIIDIKNSRKMTAEARLKAQFRLKDCIDALNPVFAPYLLYEMEFSGGDGVEGVFDTAVTAYLYCRMFMLFIYPVPVRCGLGSGTIDVVVENGKTNAQDGSAFHRARRCLTVSRSEPCRRVLFCAEKEQDLVINALLLCASLLHCKQTAVQQYYQLLLELHSPIALDEPMAKRLEDASPVILELADRTGKGKKLQNVKSLKTFRPVFLKRFDVSSMTVSTAKHGIASAAAKAAGVKPQNVLKVWERGASVRIRDIEAAAALLLQKDSAFYNLRL